MPGREPCCEYVTDVNVVLVCSQKELRDTARLIPNLGGDFTCSMYR